jgi:hypothetical protein
VMPVLRVWQSRRSEGSHGPSLLLPLRRLPTASLIGR